MKRIAIGLSVAASLLLAASPAFAAGQQPSASVDAPTPRVKGPSRDSVLEARVREVSA